MKPPRAIAVAASVFLICSAAGYGAYSYLRVERPKYPSPQDDPRCPPGMAYIPAGLAQVWDEPPPEPPRSGIYRVAPQAEQGKLDIHLEAFCLDRTDVTVTDYETCVRADQCVAPTKLPQFADTCNYGFPERGFHPINCVSWGDAKSYCGWKGKRLPLYNEWVYAAQGGAAHNLHPWGNGEGLVGTACRGDWTHKFGTCSVRSFPNESFGLFDMGGNVNVYTAAPLALAGFDWNDDVTRDQEHLAHNCHCQEVGPSNVTGIRCAK